MDEWVEAADGRVLVLLGAGASKPNLPTSAQLLEEVSTHLDATLTGDLTVHWLWRAIREQVEKIRVESGDIEDAYEAVRTLSYQDSDPTRYWIDGFTPFDFYLDDERGRRLRSQDAEFICAMLKDRSVDVLAKSAKGAPLEHFEALLRAPKVGVVALNYDDLLEKAAAMYAIPLATGAAQWDGGFAWTYPPESSHLLKVHGSYLWRSSRVLNPGVDGLPNVGLYEVSAPIEAAPNKRMDSTVVFGAGLKLTPHGPFPALMRAFTDHLEEAELLVAVGYRFAEEHISAAIYRWAALDPRRRLMIVDPSPKLDPPFHGDTYGALLSALWEDYRDPSSGVPGYAGSTGENRFRVVKQGVVEAFPTLFRGAH